MMKNGIRLLIALNLLIFFNYAQAQPGTEKKKYDQAEKFLGAGVERAGFVGLMVQGEEALDAEVPAIEDFLIELGARFVKIVHFVGHESSGGTALVLYRQ